MHPKLTLCCETPISMFSNCFGKKQVLRGTFGVIWRSSDSSDSSESSDSSNRSEQKNNFKKSQKKL